MVCFMVNEFTEGDVDRMLVKRLSALVLILSLCFVCLGALAEGFEPLPMDNYTPGPKPKDACYLSDTEYQDESISVKIYTDNAYKTDYVYAHVKISHPSQLRTAPATIQDKNTKIENVNFRYTAELTARGRYVANAANAVISINGDYFIKTDKCQVVLRQGQQVRNKADGSMDLLIIDKNGDLSALKNCTQAQYNEYLDAHEAEMYNVFCFGPVLVENCEVAVEANYNGVVGGQNSTQRSAICQLGPLEYMIITCNGPQTDKNKGMTIPEFASVCQEAAQKLNGSGCLLAFNLDGGNSATMNFKTLNKKTGALAYAKVNCPEIERFLSDIIYFATLVR